MFRTLLLALLCAGPLLAQAASADGLDAAVALDRRCLLEQAYAHAPTLRERQARIEPALTACINLRSGTGAVKARALSFRNAPLVAGTPAAEAMLDDVRSTHRSWLRHVVAYCHAQDTAPACSALLERTEPRH